MVQYLRNTPMDNVLHAIDDSSPYATPAGAEAGVTLIKSTIRRQQKQSFPLKTVPTFFARRSAIVPREIAACRRTPFHHSHQHGSAMYVAPYGEEYCSSD